MPVVTTLMARGAFPDSHPQHLGMPGMHGTVAAVAALQKSDLIISLGARFDDRVTGNLDTFAPGAKIIHADIDPAEIGKNRHADVPIVGDVREVLHRPARRRSRPTRTTGHTGDYEGWVKFLEGVRDAYPLGYDTPERLARAAVRHRAARRDRRPGRHLHRRRRPAPDVGGALRRLREAEEVDQLRWPRHHGLRGPGGDGRAGRLPRPGGLGDRRRRLLPDDQPGAGHLRDQQHPDQGRDHQQRVARHGPAVADAVLQPALLQHRPALQADPRLREARRRLRLRRPGVREPRRRRRDHHQGDGDQRRPGGRRLPGAPRRDGLADGRRRHQQRRHQVRARPRAPVRRGRL